MFFRRGVVFTLLAILLIYVWPRDKPMMGPLYGRENLAAFFAAQVRARADGTPVVIHIVGDSKATGGQVSDGYRLDQLLTSAANGYPVQITMEGFGGKNSLLWAQTEAADFVAQHPSADLLIVDFGTNEGVTGVAQTLAETEANHLAAIATIRASRSPSSLSIMLLGQTPCNNDNPLYNQTTANMIAINAILKSVAEQTNSAFFDPLELFSRAHAEAGWMDQLGAGYGGGNVHPGDPFNLVFVGEVAKVLFPLPYSIPAGASGITYPTLQGGWLKWATGYEPRAVLVDGKVQMNGMIKPGLTAANTPLFTLPVGYRPPVNKFFSPLSSNANTVASLFVLATGVVTIPVAFTGIYISLDDIGFLTF